MLILWNMENNSFKIKGGKKLKGEIIPQGAKNEVLQIICAVLLTKEKVVVNNIPDILDVRNLIQTLRDMGVKVSGEKNNYTFQADEINLEYLKTDSFQEQASSLRGALMIAGPLLGRFGETVIPKPGGDKIGIRPVGVHVRGMEQLGASFENKDGMYFGIANKLVGNYIYLEEPSVTGTANILMTAVLADGETTIYNAACEPYIKQLSKMLVSMGAKIEGIGTNKLVIKGVGELSGCEHTVLPDMLEIGSFIGLGAIIGDGITIKNVHYEELGLIPVVFEKLGITIEKTGDDIFIPPHDSYTIKKRMDGNIITIYDAPWPGFTPDLLSIILVTASQANGSVLVHQKMFDGRLFFTDNLIKMGAQIILCDPHRAVVVGLDKKQPLLGTKMTSPDIRAGMALLIAALAADGESTIQNIKQIDRGYENIDERLRELGAEIERV